MCLRFQAKPTRLKFPEMAAFVSYMTLSKDVNHHQARATATGTEYKIGKLV